MMMMMMMYGLDKCEPVSEVRIGGEIEERGENALHFRFVHHKSHMT
jgi:hypothetical protein